jgi:hypothetical protein
MAAMTSTLDRRALACGAVLAASLVACKTQVFPIYDDARVGDGPPPFGGDAPRDALPDAPPICGSRATCLVFATGLAVDMPSGNIDGVDGANTICQSAATAASLPGTFFAWLSDNVGRSPSTTFSFATVPYTLVDGTVIAMCYGQLTSGTLLQGIAESETGSAATGVAWTNTNTDGTSFGGPDCVEWTDGADDANIGVIGDLSSTTAMWTLTDKEACSATAHLMCFEQ